MSAGRLDVNGTLGTAATTVTVQSGGTLGGSGTIGGSVVVLDGTFAPGNSPGTLNIVGNFTLDAASNTNFELGAPGVVGGASNDFTNVGGNATLAGTLNLSNPNPGGGAIQSGYYTLLNVAGTTTGNFATVTTAAGPLASDVNVYVTNGGAAGNQVNALVNTGGQLVQFWDGANTSANGAVNGGNGTWNAASTNWTTVDGAINDSWRGNVGVFGGAAGTIAVAGTQAFQGLQFTTDGYVVNGGTLNMTGDVVNAAASFVNVNGGVTATINSVLAGNAANIGLDKIGNGTLILGGANTYTGPMTVQAGTLVNNGTLASAVANAATFTNNGGVGGAVTNSGTFTNSATGTVAGLVTNTAGTTSNAGQFTGGAAVTGGTLTNTATGTIAGGLTNAATADNAGAITGGVANSGTFGNTGTVAGGLTNAGIVNAAFGAINGAIANNAGAFNVSGAVTSDNAFTNAAGATLAVLGGGAYTVGLDLVNGGALTVAAGGTLNVTGNLNVAATGTVVNGGTINDDLNNAGVVTNNAIWNANVASNTGTITNSAAGTWTGSAANSAGGTLANAGIWNGAITNAGTLTTTGTVNGAVINTGLANASGTITGAIANNAGTFNIAGALAIGSALTNAAAATLNANAVPGGTAVTNAGALAFTNAGVFNAGAVAGGSGSVTSFTSGGVQTVSNSGTMNVNGALNFTGAAGSTYTNQAGGVLSMANGNTTDQTNVSGTYVGVAGSQIRSDINLSDTNANPAVQKADRLVAGLTSGTSAVAFTPVAGPLVFLANPINVVSSGAASTGTFTSSGLPTNGLLNYNLVQTAPGDWGVVSTVNTGAIAATSTSITAAIASIDAGFHQPASALVASAASQEPNKWSGGPWIRFNAGTSKVNSTGTAMLPGGGFGLGPQTSESSVRTNFSGFQGGFDSGLLNIGSSGWNMHIGMTGGYIEASARELKTQQGNAVLSSTVNFKVPFVGAYVVATHGSFFTDFMVRRDFYNMRVSNNLIGVQDAPLDGTATNVNGSVGYHFDIGNSWFVEPQSCVSYTRSTFDSLAFNPNIVNGNLSFDTLESLLARAGVRIGTAFLVNDKVALQPFVTLSVWHEFKENATSQFNQIDPATNALSAVVPVSTTRVGTFGQVGFGVSGQILQTGFVGFVRGDVRFGERLEGGAFVTGARYSFSAQ